MIHLFKHNWTKEQILSLHKFLEGVLVLSGEHKLEYLEQEKIIEEEYKVSYMTTAEWYGHQQGLKKGVQQGEANLLCTLLECKFNSVPEAYLTKVQDADENTLLIWGKRVLTANTIEEVFIEA